MDSNGCYPKLTYNAMETWTDFNMLRWVQSFGDVNIHSFTHNTSNATTLPTWVTEEGTDIPNFKALGQLSNPIIGSRAPFLEFNDPYFRELMSLNLTFDSSLVQTQANGVNPYWPFTLDYGVPDPSLCAFAPCTNQNYPGLWEFPMTNPDVSNVDNVMDPNITNFAAQLANFKANFLASYNYNKAPRGIYWHWRYLSTDNNFGALDTNKVAFLVELYNWITTNFPDVIFATESQVLQWMQNPVNTSATKLLPMFQCKNPFAVTPDTACPTGKITCNYAYDSIQVCGTVCPDRWPGLGVQWNWYNATNPNANGQTNANLTHWLSSSITNDGSGSGYVCVDVTVKNPNTAVAGAYLFTAKTCSKYAVIDPTALWSNTFVVFNEAFQNNTVNGFHQIGGNNPDNILYPNPTVAFPKNTAVQVASFCMTTLTGFNFKKHINYGIDFYSSGLNCEAGHCKVFCGDGYCNATAGETSTTCPVDCASWSCPSPSRLLSSSSAFLGEAKMTSNLPQLRQKNKHVCINMDVKNTGETTVKSHILTVKVCDKTASLISFSGYEQAQIQSEPNVYRQVAHGLNYLPGESYNSGKICFTVEDGFDMSKIFASVELDSNEADCTTETCEPTCGNGICEDEENLENCAVDCRSC